VNFGAFKAECPNILVPLSSEECPDALAGAVFCFDRSRLRPAFAQVAPNVTCAKPFLAPDTYCLGDGGVCSCVEINH